MQVASHTGRFRGAPAPAWRWGLRAGAVHAHHWVQGGRRFSLANRGRMMDTADRAEGGVGGPRRGAGGPDPAGQAGGKKAVPFVFGGPRGLRPFNDDIFGAAISGSPTNTTRRKNGSATRSLLEASPNETLAGASPSQSVSSFSRSALSRASLKLRSRLMFSMRRASSSKRLSGACLDFLKMASASAFAFMKTPIRKNFGAQRTIASWHPIRDHKRFYDSR